MACLFTKAFILSAVRSLLSEPVPLIFSDDAINNWIEEAAVDLSGKILCYEVEDDITTAENTMEYSEPTDCLKVHSCRLQSYEWVEHFDNADWFSLGAGYVWDGTKWNSDPTDYYPHLDTLGTWADGFRPTKVRITFTPSPQYMSVEDASAYDHYNNAAYASAGEATLDWTAQGAHTMTDIDQITLGFLPSAKSITNIEFWAPGTTYKSLFQIHPLLVNHLPHDSPGEPICYYHHHNKIGFWPVPDDIYAIKVLSSKRTDDITNIPCHMRHFAILDCLAKARLSEGWKDDYAMLNALYQHNLMFHRNDIWQPGYEVDSMDMLQIPDVGKK